MSMVRPDLVLLGFGMGDGQQLTLEGEALLRATGRAFLVGPTRRVQRTLRRLRVRSVNLNDQLDTADPVDGYLAVADTILTSAATDPPVAVLFPGHPLVSNSLARYLLVAAGERGLAAQAVPGVSPIDLLVSMTGLDIAAAGLQVFDARRLVERPTTLDTRVPLALLEPAAVTVSGDGAWEMLGNRLTAAYPASHPALVVASAATDSAGGITQTTVGSIPRVAAEAPAGAVVFIDRYVRQDGG
jgi:precorrin-6B methylase 1